MEPGVTQRGAGMRGKRGERRGGGGTAVAWQGEDQCVTREPNFRAPFGKRDSRSLLGWKRPQPLSPSPC